VVRPPEFITFTGADDRTELDGMVALSRRYPIEWGILFNPTRQGLIPRFPGAEALSRFVSGGLRLSAHLCGGYSRAVMERRLGAEPFPVDLRAFARIQVNHSRPVPAMIEAVGRRWNARGIAQCRGPAFPEDASVDWLYDRSGGRGREPSHWPPYPGRLAGFAGGIGADNVVAVIAEIAATGPYWIDMESKVRTDDCFDLALCEQVCRAVFPSAGAPG